MQIFCLLCAAHCITGSILTSACKINSHWPTVRRDGQEKTKRAPWGGLEVNDDAIVNFIPTLFDRR